MSPTRRLTRSNLFRVGSSGGSLQELAGNAAFPAPAPDGIRLAFLSLLQDGSGHLMMLDLASGLTTDLGIATWGSRPTWTRDGDQLIYGTQGSALKLTPSLGGRTSLVRVPLPLAFAASPTGERVAFSAPDGLHIATETGDTVVFRAGGQVQVNADVRWSRDGSTLAFVVTRGGFAPELWLVDELGANLRMVFRGGTEYLTGLDWAPDARRVIFTRTPTGSSISSASEIWKVGADGNGLVAMTRNQDEESSPQFSPDGTQIAFLRRGDLWVMGLGPSGLPLEGTENPAGRSGRLAPIPPAVSRPTVTETQLTPPPSIRVYHSQSNTCRNEPVGQIDTIDFETYVKRVVPAEVYASWPPETLKSQAVAARSYAWFWVLQHTAQAWDVTDSTSYQYMCDSQYTSTNNATDATQGQYGDYGGNIIFAAYGARNGDPTLTNNWGNPYLIAVDDPVSFGDPVLGNGIGLSQWGAYHWANSYGWNYQQILMHYYSGVSIQSPAGATPDSRPPIAGMIYPWSQWGVTSNHIYLSASASDDSSKIASMAFVAHYFDGSGEQTVSLNPAYDGVYWNYVADLSSIPDQSGITVTPQAIDGGGNSFSGNGVGFALDRSNPIGSVTAPSNTPNSTVTLNLIASDSGPSGLSQMAFSNNWVWQGENQSVTNNSGNVVNDASALNGKALRGQVGINPPGLWYGPDTGLLPLDRPYRAYFRLKTDDATTSNEVAMLDVAEPDNTGGVNIFGLKRLRGTDFRSANAYQEFYVDFDWTGPVTQGLQFRVTYRATANLWLDRIIVVSYPSPFATNAEWTLTPGNGSKTIQAKFIDGVGNISSDAIATIWVGPTPTPNATPTSTRTTTPTPTPILTPEIWLPFIVR